MRVDSSWNVQDATVLKLTEPIPLTDWRKMVIGGVEFEPRPVMDSGDDVIAVAGKHNLDGEEVMFF